MKQTFSIFVTATLLLASSSAEAARSAGNSNLILPPTPPISTAPPQTNPIGGTLPGDLGFPQTNSIGGVGTGQNFGALPGEPGSPTYNPNAALQPLNNPAGTTAPGTSSGM